MNKTIKEHEDGMSKVSSHDDVNHETMIHQAIDRENTVRNNALIELLLDHYKQKIESKIRIELDEKYRTMYERKFEIEMIKSGTDALQCERERLKVKELEEQIRVDKSMQEEREALIAALKEEKAQFDVKLVKEINMRKALEEEKQALGAALANNEGERDSTVHASKDFAQKNKSLQREIAYLRETLQKEAFAQSSLQPQSKKEKMRSIVETSGKNAIRHRLSVAGKQQDGFKIEIDVLPHVVQEMLLKKQKVRDHIDLAVSDDLKMGVDYDIQLRLKKVK